MSAARGAGPVPAGPAEALPKAYSRRALWWLAARPKTLALSWSPIVVGASLAHREGALVLAVVALATLGATAIQIGTNLFNDWGDAARGADTDARLGPLRVTQGGLLASGQVFAAGLMAFLVATSCGVGLILVGHIGAWPLVAVGTASLIAGYCYTAGPYPLAYHGLGEVFAGLFFGPVAVATTYALASGHVSLVSLALGAAIGAFAASVLLINNVRDADQDVLVGKRTLAVRLGTPSALYVLAGLLALPYVVVGALIYGGELPLLAAQALTTAPLAARIVGLANLGRGRALNELLAKTVQLQLLFGLLLALAISWT